MATVRARITDLWRLGPSEVVALVGAGGKTTLMDALARDYEAAGRRVILTTTTRILSPAPGGRPLIVADSLPRLLSALREEPGAAGSADSMGRSPVVGAGLDEQGKVVGVDPEWVRALRDVLGVEAVLVEADGAAGRSLKAPAEWEPVIPPCASLVVSVAGLDAQGATVDEAHVHRPAVLAALLGLAAGDRIPPSALLRAAACGYRAHVPSGARFLVYLNKADRWPPDGALEAAARAGGDETWVGQLSSQVEMRCLRPTEEAPAAVILAAGLGSRMGGGAGDVPKVLARLGRTTVVGCVVRAAVESRAFGDVVVVAGREVEALKRVLRQEIPAGGYEVVRNPRPEEGMASSLRLGVLAMREPRDLFVALGDQPLVTPATFRRILEAWAVAREQGAAAAGLDTGVLVAGIDGATAEDRGVVGPPVVMHRSLLPMVLELAGDSGARDILRRYAGRVESVPALGGEALDVDSPEDLDDIRALLAEDGPALG